MTALIIGFISLVILPVFILAEVLNRFIKEPSESADHAKNNSLTLTSHGRSPTRLFNKKADPFSNR